MFMDGKDTTLAAPRVSSDATDEPFAILAPTPYSSIPFGLT
jgi:hypothetical protein